MTIEERVEKLRYYITCMKCEARGKVCDPNCPTQYDAGNMGEIIENLEEISKALVLKYYAKTHLNSIYGTMVTDSIYCDTDSIKMPRIPTQKIVTVKQLEDMYCEYEKHLWREHEDVRGDDMIEIGIAEQLLQEELYLLGCWDNESEDTDD